MSTQTNAPQTSEQDRKMTKGELISYGLGGMASTMPHQFRTSYAMNFLSNVAGLHVGAVGILSTIMLIWDASNDLIIGRIADCTNTKRFGKYRPHMIMGILLWAAVVIMLFSVPSLPETGMWIYYVLALFLYSTFYTQFTVPWQALNSVMTHDPQERNLMLTCRQYGGFIAGAAVGIITMPLVQHFADPKTGWLVSAGIVCVTMVITGLLSAHGARRVDYYNSLPTPEPLHIRGQLGIIFKNRAVICAALLLGVVELVNATSSATSLYYLDAVVGNVTLKSVFSLATLAISLVFVPMMPAVLKRFGKQRSVLLGMILVAIPSVLLMVRRENATVPEIIVWNILGSLGFVMANIGVLAMIPDCTDYTEWKFGTVQAGFVNSSITFMRQFAAALPTTIVGVALAAVSYNTDPDSQAVMDVIINIKILYPFLLLAAAVVLLKLYPITPAFAKQMRAELKERRAKAGQ